MIKGPKAILSSAIANALSEYFIINPNTNIESNLLHDAKIILRQVQLKPQRSIAATATVITTTGCVDKVVFSWTWSVGGGGDTGEWIRDALLVIEGAKFECNLEHGDDNSIIKEDEDVEELKAVPMQQPTASATSSFVNPSTIDDKSAKAIKSTPGGIAGFVTRQIEMVIDNLTLRMVDFELKINVLPPQALNGSSDEADVDAVESSVGDCRGMRSFLIGVDQVELLSFGRETATTSSHHGDNDDVVTTSLLKQRINLRSFRASLSIENSKGGEGCGNKMNSEGVEQVVTAPDNGNIDNLLNELAFLPTKASSCDGKRGEHMSIDVNSISNGGVKENVYHLIKPFSYSANVTRAGSKRFSGLTTGVEVIGILPSSEDEEDSGAGGIALHMGKTQLESLSLLGDMMLAPSSTPSDSGISRVESTDGDTTTPSSSSELMINESESETNTVTGESDPSSFILPLSFATLVADDKTFSVSDISMKYKADGTICQFDAKKVSYESIDGGLAEASHVYASMRPTVKMTIDSIDTLSIPDAILLEKPIELIEIRYEGNTVVARLPTIDIITFDKKQDCAPSPRGSPSKDEKQTTKESPLRAGHKEEPTTAITAPKLPFSLDINAKGFHVKKYADESSMEIANFQLFCNENKVGNSADVALNIGHFKNPLASVSDIYLCASLPWNEVNCINALNLSVQDATIVSGHSVQDWQESFQPKRKFKAAKTTSTPVPVIRLPNASIADMKLSIVLKTNMGIKVDQTPLTIKAFRGKEGTTSKDVINYYTVACLSRVPDFISNAEVLGLNLVDNTAATWGNFIGLAAPLGGFTGLAAVVGVDAVKNTMSAGKRGRGKGEGDQYEASDVARGLFQAAKEATRRGANMRGKRDNSEGNVIDWAIGATTTTTEYVGENKTRLGGAAAGGGGFLVGMALGGPIGAVIGGLVTSAATGKTIQTIDERHKKKKENQLLLKKN